MTTVRTSDCSLLEDLNISASVFDTMADVCETVGNCNALAERMLLLRAVEVAPHPQSHIPTRRHYCSVYCSWSLGEFGDPDKLRVRVEW